MSVVALAELQYITNVIRNIILIWRPTHYQTDRQHHPAGHTQLQFHVLPLLLTATGAEVRTGYSTFRSCRIDHNVLILTFRKTAQEASALCVRETLLIFQ